MLVLFVVVVCFGFLVCLFFVLTLFTEWEYCRFGGGGDG